LTYIRGRLPGVEPGTKRHTTRDMANSYSAIKLQTQRWGRDFNNFFYSW